MRGRTYVGRWRLGELAYEQSVIQSRGCKAGSGLIVLGDEQAAITFTSTWLVLHPAWRGKPGGACLSFEIPQMCFINYRILSKSWIQRRKYLGTLLNRSRCRLHGPI